MYNNENIKIEWNDEDSCFVAYNINYSHIIAGGSTKEETLANLNDHIKCYLENRKNNKLSKLYTSVVELYDDYTDIITEPKLKYFDSEANKWVIKKNGRWIYE